MNETIKTIFDHLGAPTQWLFHQPLYISLTGLGLLICAALVVCGIALAKLRFSPLWVLGMLAPVAAIPLLWILAYKKWPQKN